MDEGFLPSSRLQVLFDVLNSGGYRCVGPQLRDGAIVYDTLTGPERLPAGVGDEQQPGHYRLHENDANRRFAWANGPQALKPLLFAPHEPLWQVRRDADGRLAFEACTPPAEKIAVIGVRGCDLAALRLQDQHFLNGPYADSYYIARREGLFLVAVHCSHPAETCFCVSTGDGPAAQGDFDLALHELDEGFIVISGSAAGAEMMHRLELEKVQAAQRDAAQQQLEVAAQQQQRQLPGRDLKQALFDNLEHARWDDVAGRCLSCGNCTAVCPTCFCHAELEQPSLDGTMSEHARQWDSCFTQGHSYIHGKVLRAETRLRYRQWLTHKLGSWHEQYGRSGCVGCGRCITWCPVGIDLTEEATAICGEGT
ncbi:MAG: 4Fe-4S dicluster domain-containing protein [Gammaproteobacteria bacterium]